MYKFWRSVGKYVWNPYKLPKLLKYDIRCYKWSSLIKLVNEHFEYGPQLMIYNYRNPKYPVQLGYRIKSFDDLYYFFKYINPRIKEKDKEEDDKKKKYI